MWPGSGYEDWFLVEDAVFEHAVDHVASAAREADDGGVVALALFVFALVVGDGRRVFGGRDERGLPQRVLEAFVAPSGGSLALDAGAGLAGGRSDAGVGGQVGRAFEVGDVAADAEQDVACGPDAYPGHRRRDHEKRVVLQELLDLVPDLAPPILDGSDIPGDRGYDSLGHGGAGHGDGLLADGLEHVVDDAAGVRHDADFVLAAFAALRFPLDEIEVFHTDRGGEFTGERIERMLDVFGITRSLSRPGNPYDNAVVESTNRLVKKELIHRNVYTNVEQPRSDVNRYVWWYNHQRLHSTLGYLSPVEFTQQGKTL